VILVALENLPQPNAPGGPYTCNKQRVLHRSVVGRVELTCWVSLLERKMLPHCHGNQFCGHGEMQGVNENWLQ
jgi:hypothetical protein